MKKFCLVNLTPRECVLLVLLCLSLALCKAYRNALDKIDHRVAPPFLHPLTTNNIKQYDH
jgi:hypothetical protein